jgi:opacity protein-like surface antigen
MRVSVNHFKGIKMNIKLLIFPISLFLFANLQADGRRYVWTYEYQTMHRGEAEVESYTEFSHVDSDSGRRATTTLQYEYEIGMNDRFDVGIYQKFKQNHNSPIAYDGFKLRMRYRVGEKGSWPLDPLIYLEYKDNAAFDHSALEAKLILARDFGKFNVSINPVLEFEFDDDETEIEFEYAAGLSYSLHDLLSLGFETKGDTDQFYWGPTLSHGKEDLWFAIGLLLPGSDDAATDRLLRFIIGVGL